MCFSCRRRICHARLLTSFTRCPVSIIKNTPFKKVLKRAFTYIGTEKSKTTHLKLKKFLFHFRTIRQRQVAFSIFLVFLQIFCQSGLQSIIDRFCQIFSFLQRHPTQRPINIPIQIIGPQHPVTILLCIFFFSNNSILALASCSDDRLKRSLPVKLRLLSPLFCPAWMIWLHSCRRYSSRIANTSSISYTRSLRIRKLTRSLC